MPRITAKQQQAITAAQHERARRNENIERVAAGRPKLRSMRDCTNKQLDQIIATGVVPEFTPKLVAA